MDDVRLVTIQFSFSNPKVVPSSLRALNGETKDQSKERRIRSTGFMVVTPTESCFLGRVMDDLRNNGFRLVDAVYQQREDRKDATRKYHMVRFLFAPVNADMDSVLETALEGLKTICDEALWRVRVFSNPYYSNGEEVSGKRALSINLEHRQPLFTNGDPVTSRIKEDGKAIGKPLPLRPESFLRIRRNAVEVLTA